MRVSNEASTALCVAVSWGGGQPSFFGIILSPRPTQQPQGSEVALLRPWVTAETRGALGVGEISCRVGECLDECERAGLPELASRLCPSGICAFVVARLDVNEQPGWSVLQYLVCLASGLGF